MNDDDHNEDMFGGLSLGKPRSPRSKKFGGMLPSWREGDVAKALNGLTPEKRNAALAFVEKKKVATRVVQRRVLEAVDKVSALQLPNIVTGKQIGRAHV